MMSSQEKTTLRLFLKNIMDVQNPREIELAVIDIEQILKENTKQELGVVISAIDLNPEHLAQLEAEKLWFDEESFLIFHLTKKDAEILVIENPADFNVNNSTIKSKKTRLVKLREKGQIDINGGIYAVEVDYASATHEGISSLLENLDALPLYLNFENLCNKYNENFGKQDISEILASLDIPELNK